ncbi:hypothetical protein ACFP7A_11350 [Sporolactobacillus kofuensis]|uniref:SIR2-like domain-containing protein n=1 Tax=Sporolactobacillus kofuensis TaxID=269672 RepID=A0ABW1WFR7_9BACL|nr:hypothetical protein [Sporolactobacillus kofuensis]MCO7176443.1 hypothetical protein [Sporolactobacillus kofuensis]
MNRYTKYNPYWPETVIFWGAGATKPLNMKTTKELGQLFQTLAAVVDSDVHSLMSAVEQAFPDAKEQVRTELGALLKLIDTTFFDQEEEAMNVLKIPKTRAQHLQMLYDWQAVKLVIKRCPRHPFSLEDLYNLLDLHIQVQKGIDVEGQFITLDRLIAARRTLDMLTQLIHAIGYAQLLQDPKTKSLYQHYHQFAMTLARRMMEEGVQRADRTVPFDDRRFYLFSYAVISMNWDPIFLWLIFNAHNVVNHRSPNIGSPSQPMKLFNDLAHFIAVRKVEDQTPSAWFPMNETAVQQLNDDTYMSGRRVRIGKFYFPHGCHGFRQCPKCGKLTFYLGNEWRIDSSSLFPPQILPSLSPKIPRSCEEKVAMESGIYDAVQCTHCGTITESHHTAFTTQTNFKLIQPSFIQEIQNDMKVALENAKHLIFAGYSLPNDDFIDRIMLSARRKMDGDKVRCSIIGFNKEAEDQWMYGEDLKKFCRIHNHSGLAATRDRVAGIFGEENVRGYAAGFPHVFMENGRVSEGKVEEMMRVW